MRGISSLLKLQKKPRAQSRILQHKRWSLVLINRTTNLQGEE
jgi:hypothetical protein